jgi:hypothetical protein
MYPYATGLTPAERFEKRVAGRSPDECWPWNGGTIYGRIWVDGRSVAVHRWSYEHHHGPIPAGMVVRHACDNPPCVNPAHLLIGTQRDNAADAIERGRAKFPVSLPGERNHAAKLTDAQVAEIARRYAARGATQAELAVEFGVAQSTIGRYVRGEARRGDDPPEHRGRGHHPSRKPCGTRAGMDTHRRAGEQACEACLAANREYMRAYKARRRAAVAA